MQVSAGHSALGQVTSTIPLGTYAGQRTFSGRSENCSTETSINISVTFRSDEDVVWDARMVNDIECRDGRTVPTTCWYAGPVSLSATRNPRRFVLDLERETAGGAPLGSGAGVRVWQCGRVQVSLPDGQEPFGRCVMLGNADTREDMSNAFMAQYTCSAGNPLSSMTDIRLDVVSVGVLRLVASRYENILLRRVRVVRATGEERIPESNRRTDESSPDPTTPLSADSSDVEQRPSNSVPPPSRERQVEAERLPDRPANSVVLSALREVMPAVAQCGRGQAGRASVNLTLSSNGSVQAVMFDNPAPATVVRDCARGILLGVRVPPFRQSQFVWRGLLLQFE